MLKRAEGTARALRIRWPVVAPAVAFVAGGVVFNWNVYRSSLVEDGDYAADALRARTAWRQTSGIFSRWDFHHPGPYPLWLKWIGMRVADVTPFGPLGGQLLVVLVLAAVSLSLVAWVFDAAGHGLAALSVFPVAALTLNGSQFGVWAPQLAHWSILAGVAAVAALVMHRWWAVPVACFAGISLVHLHVLWAPLGVITLGVAATIRWRRHQRLERREIVATGAVCTLMLLPLVAGVIVGDSYWSSYLSSSDEPGRGAVRSWRRGIGIVTEGVLPGSGWGYLGWLLVVLALVLATWVAATRLRGAERVAAYAAAALVVYLLAICRFDFLNAAVGGVVVLPLLVPALLSVVELPSRWRVPALSVAAAFPLAMIGAPVAGEAVPPSGRAERAMLMFEAERQPGDVLIVDHAEIPWDAYASATALALLADREGVDWCVAARRWPYWTGDGDVCGAEVEGVVVMFVAVDMVSTGRV